MSGLWLTATTPRRSSRSGRRYWAEHGTYEVDNDDPRPHWYTLCMYPYPSGAAHMGHVRNYTFGDLNVRHRTMNGYAVLSPMGFDSFGLPAENAAIKTGRHPREFTDERIEQLRSSILRIGAVYDWRRQVTSHSPEYQRWTQWIFLRLLEAGLAYRRSATVNWDPVDQTVLANEQVLPDGTAERSGAVVEKRDLEQWFFRITDYADQLLDDLDGLEWPERVKTMQRNWIGRSEGAEFDMAVTDAEGTPRADGAAVRVFTTRPDTSFGMTYAVMAPEHPLVDHDRRRRAAGRGRRVRGRGPDGQRRRADVVGGLARQARHLHRRLPAQPLHRLARAALPRRLRAHGLRHRGDHGRARRGPARLGLRHRCTACPSCAPSSRPTAGRARRTPARAPTSTAASWTAWARPRPSPRPSPSSRPRASARARSTTASATGCVSRQRFWGCPIPVVYCDGCGIVPVPDDQLPVLAPDDVEFLPTGESPLRSNEGFLHTTCPSCGGPATRETDTMDTFVDSSWYFLRFCEPWSTEAPVSVDAAADVDAGRPVHRRRRARHPPPDVRPLLHQGAGRPRRGAEGAARAVLAAVHPGHDPSRRRQDVEVEGQPGRARGDPRRRGRRRPAPGPPLRRAAAGRRRLGGRRHRRAAPASSAACGVWRRARSGRAPVDREPTDADIAVDRSTHRLIAKVSDDYERWSYNTAVAAFMEFTNELYRYVQGDAGVRRADARRGRRHAAAADGTDGAARHRPSCGSAVAAATCTSRRGPSPIPAKLVVDTVTMVVQVNGKVRDRIEVPAGVDAAEAEALALASEKVQAHLGGNPPRKVIARPPQLVNIVAG